MQLMGPEAELQAVRANCKEMREIYNRFVLEEYILFPPRHAVVCLEAARPGQLHLAGSESTAEQVCRCEEQRFEAQDPGDVCPTGA